MAKGFQKKHDTGRAVTTKTAYGTDNSMVVTDENILNQIELKNDCVLCKDDDGYYITPKTNIDTGLADPFRHCLDYRKKLNLNIKEVE